jgi:hypothetical protein
MNDRSQAFQMLAPMLDKLVLDPNARVSYELMSDSLIWSDELPPPAPGGEWNTNCLRGAFRFRTTLILGKPDERFRARWEELQTLCPNWPAFLPDRRSPDPGKVRLFEEGRARLNAEMDELDERFERQRREKQCEQKVS